MLEKECYICECGENQAWIISNNKEISCAECGATYRLVHGLCEPIGFNKQRKHYKLKDK